MFNETECARAKELAAVLADRALSMFVHSRSLPKIQRKGALREYERLADAAELLAKIGNEESQ